MPYALVGTVGGADQGSSGGAITPAWGTNEGRQVGNLLVMWLLGTGTATLPTVPSGWTSAIQVAGTSCSASIFYKIAAGNDGQPTVAAVTSTVLTGTLAEFQGNLITASPVDQTASATGTTSPLAATAASDDQATGELVVGAASVLLSTAGTMATLSEGWNTGAAVSVHNNSGTSTVNHYDMRYCFTIKHSTADSDSFSYTTTNVTGAAVVMASFLLAPYPTGVLNRMPLGA